MIRQSLRRLPARLVIASVLVFGPFVASAGADERHDDHRGGDRHDNRGHDGGRSGGWDRGNYAAPPVVYGGPGYYPPPVVYGPAVGIALPGITIGIQ